MLPGQIVYQPGSVDPNTAAIYLHYLMLGQRPIWVHCGVFVGGGEMVTASGDVRLQDAGATGNIAVNYAWRNWPVAKNFLYGQLGRKYDWIGWLIAAVEPLLGMLGIPRAKAIRDKFTCSSLVAAAMLYDDPSLAQSHPALTYRTVTPDDIAEVVHP